MTSGGHGLQPVPTRPGLKPRTSVLLAIVLVCSVAEGEAREQYEVPAAREARQQPAGPAAGLLAGRVVDADTGDPVGGARVMLAGAQPGPTASGGPTTLVVITDSQGRFYFAGLPPGPYLPIPSREGYVEVVTAQPFRLAEGARIIDVKARLRRLGSITGTLRDDSGDPVTGTEVIAYRRYIHQGRRAAFTRMARDRSDDRGGYRLRNLPVGEYFICACSRDPIPFDGPLLTTLATRPNELLAVAKRAAAVGANAASLDDTLRTYAPTFHPNTPLASRATRVAVAPGEDRTAIDIDLTAVRAARVSGVIIGGSPASIAASSVRLIPANDLPDALMVTQLTPMVLQPDGRFDFAGVPPGQYSLIVTYDNGARVGGPSGAALSLLGARGAAMSALLTPPTVEGQWTESSSEQLWAFETITVGDTDVTGLVIGLQRGVTVRGRFEYVGSVRKVTERRNGVTMSPVSVALLYSNGSAGPSPNGAFEIPNIIPGRYAVLPTGAVPGWKMGSVTMGGADITDLALVVGPNGVSDLVITMTDALPATIEGTAVLKPGESFADFQVCVFTADRRYWAEPFPAVRRFWAARLSASASFTITGIPSGEYYVAVRAHQELGGNAPSLDWMEDTVLEELARTAERVSVADGETKVIRVKR